VSENTQLAIVEEQALRISELSAALETLRDDRTKVLWDLNDALKELEDVKVRLSAASARADRYLTHLQNGVEL